MVEFIQKERGYVSGFRDGKIEQLKTDISLIQELAFEASNFEDFKLRLRDQIRKMDKKSWF